MRTSRTITIPAENLIPGPDGVNGDFLTGLDNGYVVALDLNEHAVLILFHTATGDEAELTCPPDMPVEVRYRPEHDNDDE